MEDFILSHFSVKSLTSSVTLPVHEPISFGFEEMVKAKAEADAVVSAEIGRQLIERTLDIGKGYKCVLYSDRDSSFNGALADAFHSEYIYDYNVVAELSAIKRRKNRR